MQNSPFPSIWIGGDLGPYRQCCGTYGRYDLTTLPCLPDDEFDSSYSWLRRPLSPTDFDARYAQDWGDRRISAWATSAEKTRQVLANSANLAGVQIPEEFLTFILDPTLVSRLRSPTDCYFQLSSNLVPGNAPFGGHFVHFLSDSQNCYEWYLFLVPGGGHLIVAADDDLAEPFRPDGLWEATHQRIVCCATSFESFIYRLWIENECWLRLNTKDQPLNPDMSRYLDASDQSQEIIE